ncbi:Sorting nexin mvp1 [Basidiobolus ranarum]|uniref:Sorting nexin MVP1 n=1 Tax=Basidiobolus ranarum TaxID=34480 RepID=A0ABR2VUZ7_9FUNG
MYEDDMTASFFQSSSEYTSPLQSSFFSTTSLDPTFGDLANPWGPQGGGSINVETVLHGIRLPLIYETAFSMAAPIDNKITLESLNKILSVSGLSSAMVEKIYTVALPFDRSSIDLNAFNVVLTLVALSQKNMDVSLENIISHKQDLPVPSLPNLSNIDFTKRPVHPRNPSSSQIKPEPSASESDPWRANGDSSAVAPVNSIIPDKPLNLFQSDGPPSSSSRLSTISSNLETYQLFADNDLISIKISPQRGGMIFKHINYVVESKQRLSSVVRRYSDFWWLLEVLTRRYPSRMLPTLPPKRIGGDEAFLERRRKGLARFINFIARHPTLKNDDVVIVFLTEPSDMGGYRRLHEINIDEEFKKVEVTDRMKTGVPHDLAERLNKLRERLDASAEYYGNQCTLMERITKRQEGSAEDMLRYSKALTSLAGNESECHDADCYKCPQIAHGFDVVAGCFKKVGTLIKDEVESSINGVVENLRRQKEIIVAFKELLDRKDKIVYGETDSLVSRIKSNQEKLNSLRDSGGVEKEIQRLITIIEQKEIVNSRNHDIFIQYSLWCELQFYHQNAAFVTLLYQHYVSDQIKFATGLTQAWKDLSITVNDLPMDISRFS